MYLRTTQRHNKDGTVIRYVQLAHNIRDPDSGHSVARTIHSFGREEQLDRAALHRLADSILRYLKDTSPADEAQRQPSVRPNIRHSRTRSR